MATQTVLEKAVWHGECDTLNVEGSASGIEALPLPLDTRTTVVSDIASLRDAWIALRARVPSTSFYQSYEWCHAWVEACARAGRPVDVRIVTVWENDRLVLLWPLSLRRLGPIGILHALAEPATQYCDVLMEPSVHATRWINYAYREIQAMPGVDAVHLHQVRGDARLETVKRALPDLQTLSREGAPFLRLSKNAKTRRSGRSVNALKRHMKHLAKLGPVTVEAVPGPQQRLVVAEALKLKAQWLESRGASSSGYQHPGNHATIMKMAEEGRFIVMRLNVGDQMAAVEIGILENGHYLSLIQTYRQCFAAHAPGRLLLWRMLETCERISTFDFLPPSRPHKTEWTEEVMPVTSYVVALNLKGRIGVSYFQTYRKRLRRTFDRLPCGIRGWLSRIIARFY